jgi:hypothetical protein
MNRTSLLFALLLSSPLHAATLTGLWEFNDSANLGKATVGTDLAFSGTAPSYSASVADDGAVSLNGVMTTVAGAANRITATHGIDPANSPGTLVSQYSIVMDIFSPAASRSGWRALFQTNTANTNDADYFIRNSNDTLGISTLGYSANPINETAWTRVVITVDLDLAGNDVKAYINGSLFHTHASNQTLTGTYALDPTLLFFSDNDGENLPLNVASLAIYDGVLTPTEVSTLGGAGAAVPEPSVFGLATLAALLGVRRRR